MFHYHLLPGGVSSVITYSLQAAVTHIEKLEEVVIVSGREENAGNVVNEIRSFLRDDRCSVSATVIPEIGYLDDNSAGMIDADSLRNLLVKKFSGYIWWVHNYHIGKNPLFTKILIEIAESIPEQGILFHIHDFPECARYANLRFIRQYYTGSLYPRGGNVWYGVINKRDYRLLRTAGLPKERIILLQNPIQEQSDTGNTPVSAESGQNTRRLLSTYPGFNPEAPSILYPVRSIRRKNVLEAGLLTKMSDPEVNLLLTLPGTSEQEKPYSDIVKQCYQQGTIRGAFPTADTVDFNDIIAFSSAVISTSVQEGFGYLFINTIQWEKPLIARNLEILGDFTPYFHPDLNIVYDSLVVPAESVNGDLLKGEYLRFIETFSAYLSPRQYENLREDVTKLCSGPLIDYSYLPPLMQVELLNRCEDNGFLRDLQKLNAPLIEGVNGLLRNSHYAHRADIDGDFGFSRYAETCKHLFNLMEDKNALSTERRAESTETDRYILDYFARLEYFRLLYAPFCP